MNKTKSDLKQIIKSRKTRTKNVAIKQKYKITQKEEEE